MVFSLRTKLAASIVVVVVLIGVVSTIIGTRLFAQGMVRQAQHHVEKDLHTAYVVYNERLSELEGVVRLAAAQPGIASNLKTGRVGDLAQRLSDLREEWSLDILNLTDADGIVRIRSRRPAVAGDDAGADAIVGRAIENHEPVSGTVIATERELEREDPALAERARMGILETPRAKPSDRRILTDGMMLKAAAPVFAEDELAGVLYGGVLLNRRGEIVDKVKATAYEGETWEGKDIGTATIFQDDVRIATNVMASDGTRATGTRVSQEVYERVVEAGKLWIARAFVVDDWYITAYGPIRSPDGDVIGILYVGVLAAKYDALARRTVLTFAGVSAIGMTLALAISGLLAGGILRPVRKLAEASQRLARGELDTRVEVSVRAGDELTELANTFNLMAESIAERDARLRENARKMAETKKLATLGQLAAGIAHEINNPLGGILMYSHILLESLEPDSAARPNLKKICTESERCKKIVKGLLDFARQTKPQRTESNVNLVLDEVIALFEHQAIFHNIEVVKDHDHNLPLVALDVAQIQEVFMNVILNAVDAMGGQGTLSLATRLMDDRRFVEIEIADTGPGIPESELDSIFEPFFTTKDVGHGTGLGLSIAYGIIERHHGSIRAKSGVGDGTSFFIRIPVEEELDDDREPRENEPRGER